MCSTAYYTMIFCVANSLTKSTECYGIIFFFSISSENAIRQPLDVNLSNSDEKV